MNYYFKVEENPTILEIFTEIAQNRLGEGTTFEYDDEKWIYDGEDIRTVEADYHDADIKNYLYLNDYISLSDLNDRVTNFQRHYTCIATTSTYTTGEDIKSTTVTKLNPTTWHYTGYNHKSVHCCPVCGGNGQVQNGFYNHTGNTWVTSTTAPEQCRSCNGKGYIVIND